MTRKEYVCNMYNCFSDIDLYRVNPIVAEEIIGLYKTFKFSDKFDFHICGKCYENVRCKRYVIDGLEIKLRKEYE